MFSFRYPSSLKLCLLSIVVSRGCSQAARAYCFTDSDNTEKLKLEDENVPNLENVRDLGVYFSQSLTWNMHIETKIKKGMSVSWMVKRNFSPKTSTKTKLCFYKSPIPPIITFGSTCC